MTRKPDTLILTGWGWPDYAGAAALVWRRFPNAELRGVSTRRLPEELGELSDGTYAYTRIIILGVGLSGDPERLIATLKALKTRRVAVEWVSALSLPDSLPTDVGLLLDVRVDDGADGITEAAARIYGKPEDDKLERRIQELLRLSSRVGETWRELLDAAMFAYRNYQDEGAYSRAIHHLAFGEGEECWTSDEKSLVAHYRRYGSRELVGKSPVMTVLQQKVETIAKHERTRVLIVGESGTGKETVAVLLHNKSVRRNEPFVSFNCASVVPDLLESRFLGYDKGAFTGANEQRKGLFEMANGGTLFLDEIGELPFVAQGLLLRVLEGGRFSRIGDREEVEVDVRVVAATHRDLAGLVRDGKFREDLFYRLNVIPIRVPPLREHLEDVDAIANGYWLRVNRRRLAPEQTAALREYAWPGNVRELYNVLERASVTGETDFIRLLAEHRDLAVPLPLEQATRYPDNLDAAVRVHMRSVYDRHGGNLSRAAEALGVSRNTVRKHLSGS